MLIAGAGLCVPAAFLLVIFFTAAFDVQSLQSAPACEVPTQGSGSQCLSALGGVITSATPGGKSLNRVTIDVIGSSVDVGYACFLSQSNACSGIGFKAGSHLVTGWWRGRVVLLGRPESAPSVITDANPSWELRQRATWLAFVVPAVSLVVAALVMWQAPAISGAERRRWLLWRAAWGSGTWTFFALVTWQVLFVAALVYMFKTSDYMLGAALLAATGIVSFLGSGVVTAMYSEWRRRAAQA